MSTENLSQFITKNKLSHIMWNVNIWNEYLYSYAKTDKKIVIKYHELHENCSLEVEGLNKPDGFPKPIVDKTKSGKPNKLFQEIITRLQSSTAVEKSVETMVDDLNLGI